MFAQRWILVAGCLLAAFLITPVFAAEHDLIETRKSYLAGDYEEVAKAAAAAIEARETGEEWRVLQARSLLTTGKYKEAREAIIKALRYYSYSIRLRVVGHEVFTANDEKERAMELVEEVEQLGGFRRASTGDPEDVVALGEIALLMGADARLVLDNFFEPVIKNSPMTKEAYLAKTRLALEKHDYALAARAAQQGLMKFPEDVELLGGLAEAFSPGDRGEMLKLVEQILEENENYIPARLLLADHLVDAEEYDQAELQLQRIFEVNPYQPEAWAYRGVMAHLRNDLEAEEKARNEALKFWRNNPKVDHLLGKKLSQKYRFAEGSKYQIAALKSDPGYLPAKLQLASDLLRIGKEEEGWKLAEAVAKGDAYDVGAYNLVTLKDTMEKYSVLTNEHFILKMPANEAEVFGKQVLELLEKARVEMTKKYHLELEGLVTVEVFGAQKDFAVRTFGMPGGEGYLGVCFGNVITANSPTVHEMNWKSVLWHEFVHVVTLNLTKNKMPRWLSEGISVYEERLAEPRWGEQMDPTYRKMILEGEMKKVSELSSAFMAPPTPIHIQFAYFQSSLVVEFLVSKYGLDKLQQTLVDLGAGMPINDALKKNFEDMDELENDFEAFAKSQATEFGNDVVWAKPERDERGRIDETWAMTHKDNFWVLRDKAEEAFEEERFADAEELFKKLARLYPRETGGSSSYARLAAIYRKEKKFEEERAMLKQWVRHDPEAQDVMLRLIELDLPQENWAEVSKAAELLEEVNPMRPELYQARALAAEAEHKKDLAVASWKTVLKLKPKNPAEVHFRLANIYRQQEKNLARKHVLLALEEAPRFRDAHALLLELTEKDPPSPPVAQ